VAAHSARPYVAMQPSHSPPNNQRTICIICTKTWWQTKTLRPGAPFLLLISDYLQNNRAFPLRRQTLVETQDLMNSKGVQPAK
jgi:hypothetical protein